MNHIRFMASACLALALHPAAWSAELFVVAHASVNLSADEVREVFLGDKQFAGSVKLAPVENASLQAEFQSKVLKVDGGRYASIWSKKGFRDGLTPPPVRSSDQDVIGAIKANPGTVGYVSKPSADVKVLQKY
jgi:hypothetical protein